MPGLSERYLVSIEVAPYEPNRQLSIINTHGGKPRSHYPTSGDRGVLVAMIGFDDVTKLQQEYDWVAKVHNGYYTIRNKLER
jgi:hypothetical protein